MPLYSLKNRLVSRLFGLFPSLSERSVARVEGVDNAGLPIPWSPAQKSLHECRLAIVTTAGVHMRGQEPFDMKDREGDPTLRVIDGGAAERDLMITHDYYDHSDAEQDINIVFPITRLRQWTAAGALGSLSHRHFGLMGHIVGRHISTLTGETSRAIISACRQDGVDIVLLTPGWGICNQSVGLAQRELEAAGIPTIGISIALELTMKVRPPRTVHLRWPFGHPLGEPFNQDQQHAVLAECMRALYAIKEPGVVVSPDWKWRRETYKPLDLNSLRLGPRDL